MKKVFVAVCIVLLAVVMFLTSCGNMSLGFGNFNFNHIRISDYTEGYCLDVNKWYDYENGIEVQTSNGNSLFLSEGTYILVENGKNCPFCKG